MKKPLHKHIGHHAKKGYSKVTKYLTERDTMFATLWVFVFIVALGSIPLNLGIMNPLKLGLKDFDFNDLSYSKLGKSATGKYDNRITIVNIGHLNREELSMLIDSVAANKPKVMGLDAYFDGPRDPYQDSLLGETFKRNKNLIVGRKLVLSGKEGDTAAIGGNYIKTAWKYAHVNIFTDSLSTIRTFEPIFEDYKHDKYPFFATALIKEYDLTKYKKLEKKGAKKVIINYTRQVDRYSIISPEELMTGQFDTSLIAGRIVLLGYVNLDPNDLEDKKFTPMNPKFAGKSIPDMNGVFIHANIISMALDDNYIKKVPLWLNILIAVVVCWLHMSFFVHYYLESHIWFHLAAKIAQVASAIFFVWLGIYLFDKYRLKVDLKFSLVTILLAVDVIYFYEAWAVWMHKKFNYKTVFKPHHH
ncbi:MAG TPA: CHASE2 domain-containing protein [Chitinophagaceae bacterium]|nr:CHASE2 domain-containing protein [Chitinophagaceae bacterium]